MQEVYSYNGRENGNYFSISILFGFGWKSTDLFADFNNVHPSSLSRVRIESRGEIVKTLQEFDAYLNEP